MLITLTGILATRPADIEGPFKNLQVLKKMDGDHLENIMGGFNSQLGVTCKYCHPWKKKDGDPHEYMDFITDEKPEKKIAREMLRMSIRLNRKYFNSAIDGQLKVKPVIWCKTCHQGLERPSMVNRP